MGMKDIGSMSMADCVETRWKNREERCGQKQELLKSGKTLLFFSFITNIKILGGIISWKWKED